MAETRDPYQVLGVARDAKPEEIQRAYRTLARRQHPDINKEPGAEERFKEINEAYHVLSDPERRARYDRFGSKWRQVPDDFARAGAGAGGPGSGFSGAGVPGGGFRGAGFRGSGAGFPGSAGRGPGIDVDLEDLLGSMFGGRHAAGPVPGADTQAGITIGVEDAFRGGRRQVTLPGPDGRPRRYDVNIPAGVIEGQRIRLAGQGNPGVAGGPPGDLYLVVHLAPHPRFRVEGRNVVLDLPVSAWEAALGAPVPLETPGGPVRVDVPPGTSSGRRLRLRGRGLPNPRGNPGDLYAEVKIMVPPTLTEAERRLFQELGEASHFNPRNPWGG
ncbi:DnaJ C-terminal domain-containing protein [Dactylosporangium sp. NPDC049525]|uniref:DnaJ C-terminal domain-containing protein n=1 Tax=Dactylosporangium sp. NPDC049525 TaxID=3154730 RepID=UPI0034222077